MAITERKLNPQEQKEIADFASRAMSNLGLTQPNMPPVDICQAIEDFIERWQEERRKPNPLKKLLSRAPAPNPLATSLGLGYLWGNQLVRQFGWAWTCLHKEGQGEAHSVVTADRSLVIHPTHFIKACLADPRADCTIMLVYNMLLAGEVSGMPANGYENVMWGVRRIVPKR
jgi:hypothetical protein